MTKKRIAPTIEQWSKLYEVAINIKRQAPWQTLWDTDLITIMLPGHAEPVFISVLGRDGDCYGICVYPGYHAVEGHYRLLDSDADPSVDPISYQNCLLCCYGSRDELAPKEREIIKTLGHKFRGQDNWIYFRAMKAGFYPWFIDAEQAELLIAALQNFVMAYSHYARGTTKVDFEGGQTLARAYEASRDEWLNAAMPKLLIPETKYNVTFSNELLLHRLKKAKSNRGTLELDIFYLPEPVQENPADAPYFPRIVLLFEQENGMLIDQKLIEPSETNERCISEMLVKAVTTYGKPDMLIVRDKYFLRYVSSFCSQLGIEVEHSIGMSCADDFIAHIPEFMGGE